MCKSPKATGEDFYIYKLECTNLRKKVVQEQKENHDLLQKLQDEKNNVKQLKSEMKTLFEKLQKKDETLKLKEKMYTEKSVEFRQLKWQFDKTVTELKAQKTLFETETNRRKEERVESGTGYESTLEG